MSYQYLFLENGRPLPATCHAWNRDLSQIAFCPNSSTIRIHSVGKDGKLGELVQELVDHDKVVTSLSWGAANNRLVSCSQDRNAFVWSLDSSSGKFVPELVALRVKNSCTDVNGALVKGSLQLQPALSTSLFAISLSKTKAADQAFGSPSISAIMAPQSFLSTGILHRACLPVAAATNGAAFLCQLSRKSTQSPRPCLA
jgi:WD40 repeat protein